MSQSIDETVQVDVRASDLAAVHQLGLTAEDAIALVATFDFSGEILREVRGDE